MSNEEHCYGVSGKGKYTTGIMHLQPLLQRLSALAAPVSEQRRLAIAVAQQPRPRSR